MYDICIIGAGMFGSAAARHASANPSLKVILIGPKEPTESEKITREIFGSHYDKGRLTRELDEHIACQILAKHCIKRYRDIERLSGIDFYHPVGFLYIGTKNSNSTEYIKQMAALGNTSFVELSANDVKNRYPFLYLAPNETALLHEAGCGYINPSDFVYAQQKIAELQGCNLLHEVVEEVKPLNTEGEVFYHEVITGNSVIHAKRVLVCTGAFTNFKRLITGPKGLVPDITVLQETAALIQIPVEEVKRLSSMPPYLYYKKAGPLSEHIGAYGLPPIQYPDDNYYLKIGHMDECGSALKTLKAVKDWYLSSGDQTVIDRYTALLKSMIPGLNIISIKGLTCVTCRSPSELPYIDRVSPTVSVAIAGNSKGAKISDEVGRIAAELAVYGKWDSDLQQDMFNIIWKEDV